MDNASFLFLMKFEIYSEVKGIPQFDKSGVLPQVNVLRDLTEKNYINEVKQQCYHQQ